MKEAFTYMLKDNKYFEKALVYGGFVLFADLLANFSHVYKGSGLGILLLILGYVATFIPSGYGISCIKALMVQKENFVLPCINVKNNFILGFKIFVAGALLGLAIGGIYIAACIIFGLIGIFAIPKDVDVNTAVLIFMIPTILIFLTVLILYVIYGLSMSVIFAKKEFYTTFFKFGLANKLIAQNRGKYFSALGLYVALFIVLIIVNAICSFSLVRLGNIGTIILSLIRACVSSYTIFVFAYITANSVPHELLDENVQND
ncbi:DUF4013 domain-containing protein [bacterium]|nr:DUF4013 domain-containing protein [bacterium]